MRKSSRQANNSHERLTRGDEQREVWSASKPSGVVPSGTSRESGLRQLNSDILGRARGNFHRAGKFKPERVLPIQCAGPFPHGPIWVPRHLRGTKALARVFLIEQAGDQTMRRSGVLFSLQRAARVQQVRTEIGRLLRQHYEASSPPMSGRLAEVIKKLQQSTSQSDLVLAADEQVRRAPR